MLDNMPIILVKKRLFLTYVFYQLRVDVGA